MTPEQKILLAYFLIAVVIATALISPVVFMRLKTKRTGKIYTPMQKVKAHLLYLLAFIPGLVVMGLYSTWDALDNKFNS